MTKENLEFKPPYDIIEEKIIFDLVEGHSHDGVNSRRIVIQVTGIVSNPPSGFCRVLNLYVDPATEKLVVSWDDTPQP